MCSKSSKNSSPFSEISSPFSSSNPSKEKVSFNPFSRSQLYFFHFDLFPQISLTKLSSRRRGEEREREREDQYLPHLRRDTTWYLHQGGGGSVGKKERKKIAIWRKMRILSLRGSLWLSFSLLSAPHRVLPGRDRRNGRRESMGWNGGRGGLTNLEVRLL